MWKAFLFQAVQFSLSAQFGFIWRIDKTLSGATNPGKSGSGSDGNKGVLSISQSFQRYWRLIIKLFSVLSRTLDRGGGIIPLQRSSRCILQPQPTGPLDTCSGRGYLTTMQWCSQCILQPQPTGPLDTRSGRGYLTTMQWCSQCILQLQPTGPLDTRSSVARGSYHSAEIQSVYSRPPTDWATGHSFGVGDYHYAETQSTPIDWAIGHLLARWV